MKFEDFWYVVALSNQLKPGQVVGRSLLGEWLALFRDGDGNPVALRDRCLHRNSRLSCGTVHQGILHCPYHGWGYDGTGRVVSVPAEGKEFQASSSRRAVHYATCERDGYVYVRPAEKPEAAIDPFPMPHYQEPGWETVRVVNEFQNTVTNCAENFIDIPHTVSVHPGVFRQPRQQRLEMTVERHQGIVTARYHNETDNLGWYTRFLNGAGREIYHVDRFYFPNVTCVEYDMGPQRRLFITSQSIPETETKTRVYTDVTYHYGFWNKLARPFVHWTAQHIIHQDIKILRIQQEVIEKYGERFSHTPADTIHVLVESIRAAIARGEDPRTLPDQSVQVSFWV